MISRTKTSTRHVAVASALASVRAEGLKPSEATVERMKRYAEGKISGSQLQRETLQDVRRRVK